MRRAPLAPTVSLHGGHSTPACSHAESSLSDLVDTARDRGLTAYALTFHAPKPSDELLDRDDVARGWSAAHTHVLTRAGFRQARELRRRTTGIALPVVLESDVTPFSGDWCGRMRELVRRLRPDYLIASAHHVRDTPIDDSADLYWKAVESAGGEDAAHLTYYGSLCSAVAELAPLAVGHLDVIRRFASTPWPSAGARKACLDLLDCMEAHDVALEVNTSPLQEGHAEPYPSSEVLREAARRDLTIVLGDDSHDTDAVGAGLVRACRVAADAGFERMGIIEDD